MRVRADERNRKCVRTLISNSCGGWVGGAPEDGWLPMAAAPRALRGSLARPPVRSLLRPARGAGGACSRPTPQAQTRYDRVWAVPSSASRTEPSGLSARWRRELVRGAPPARPSPATEERRINRQQGKTSHTESFRSRSRHDLCGGVGGYLEKLLRCRDGEGDDAAAAPVCSSPSLCLPRPFDLRGAPESRTAAANPSPQSKSPHSEIMSLACVNSQRGKCFSHRQC